MRNEVIWKYPVKVNEITEHKIPGNAIWLSAGADPSGVPCVWARHSKCSPGQGRAVRFIALPTGEMPNPKSDETYEFLGRADCGQFVWHIFEVFDVVF